MGKIIILDQEKERQRKKEDAADRAYEKKENRNINWLITIVTVPIGGAVIAVIVIVLLSIFGG